MAVHALKPQGIKIEKGVPLSDGRSGRAIYPFGSMEVGDSFEVAKAGAIRAAASVYGARNGKKFSVRMSSGGFRCWRVA